MEWQPIETVPKDGEMVLVSRKGKVGCACVVEKEFDGLLLRSFNAAWGEEGRLALPLNDYDWPTHWMPLPEPPK